MGKTKTTQRHWLCIKWLRLCLLACLLLSAGIKLPAQLTAGTKTTQEWTDEIVKNMDKEKELSYNVASVYNSANLSIAAYIISDVNGMANCDYNDIAAGVALLNNNFIKINLAFSLKPVQYIDDYNYSIIQDEEDLEELVKKHSEENTINLYLVESAEVDSVPCYGFTYFPNDTIRNYIFLNKEFIRGNYLTTLMGHFLGLLSTHDTLGGYEQVDESNCSVSGDFLCDTWADPNLLGWVDTNCVYFGNHIDTRGEFYVPSVANLMSESYDDCKCIFTPHQYRRILFYLKNYRDYLR